MNLSFVLVGIFLIGYVAIILEHVLKINKAATALFMAALCWMVRFISIYPAVGTEIDYLSHHLGDVAQVIFFLLGAMALVELIDSHEGFRILTDKITTSSQKKLLWIICISAFLLSSIFDNLTTTILMVSLLKKLIPHAEERLLPACFVVVAANAGGAWTPIGDVTTTMLWINGQLSSLAVMKALFWPSLISLLVPLVFYTFRLQKRRLSSSFELSTDRREKALQRTPESERQASLVFGLGFGALVLVPLLKAWLGIPPFMGILLGLSILWMVTDRLHHPHPHKERLRVPHILGKIDLAGILFFLGILLCVGALQRAGMLDQLATWLNQKVGNLGWIATLIGLLSAVIDNVPLVAATMGMYTLEKFPMDHALWHMIAYAAGTGGSILIIGSSSGVALMGMEKISFATYFRKIGFVTLIGYLIGMGVYLFLESSF